MQNTLEIGERMQSQREDDLVETLMNAAVTGKGGVTRLNDTLRAVHAGQVHTLFVHRDFHARAYQCVNCEFMSAHKIHNKCPYCGHELVEIPDVIDIAVQQVIRAGGEVKIVADDPEMQKIGIGALLRFRLGGSRGPVL